MSSTKEPKEWTRELLKSVNLGSLLDLTPQCFVNSRAMTRDVMAKNLCDALRIVEECQKEMVKLKQMNEQLDNHLMEYVPYVDETRRLTKELEEVKGKSAIEVFDLQREVVTLQHDLLAEKDRQLAELRTSVVESVQTTVKEGLRSYSKVVEESCKAPSSAKLQAELKSVVKTVVCLLYTSPSPRD